MKAEETIYSVLSADAGIDAICGDRIYPDARPAETGVLPAIVFQRSDTEVTQGLSGAVLAQRALIQIACLATLRADAEGLADVVVTIAAAQGWVYLNRTAAFEPESEIYVAAIDVQLQE